MMPPPPLTSADLRCGDWVRFMSNGNFVIGQIEYIVKTITGLEFLTTAGVVTWESIMEIRQR